MISKRITEFIRKRTQGINNKSLYDMDDIAQSILIKKTTNEVVMMLTLTGTIQENKKPKTIYNTFIAIFDVDSLSRDAKIEDMVKIHPVKV